MKIKDLCKLRELPVPQKKSVTEWQKYNLG